jgi:hypothetical protein
MINKYWLKNKHSTYKKKYKTINTLINTLRLHVLIQMSGTPTINHNIYSVPRISVLKFHQDLSTRTKFIAWEPLFPLTGSWTWKLNLKHENQIN